MPPSEEPPPETRPEPGPRYFPGGERVAFFVCVVAVVGATAYMLWPILVGPLFGLAGGSLFGKLVERYSGPRKRKLIAALITIFVVVLVLGPTLAFTIWLAQEIAGEVARLSTRVDELSVMFETAATRAGPLGPPLRELATSLTRDLANVLPTIAQRAGDFAGAIGAFLAQLLVGLVLFCMTLYYTLVKRSRQTSPSTSV